MLRNRIGSMDHRSAPTLVGSIIIVKLHSLRFVLPSLACFVCIACVFVCMYVCIFVCFFVCLIVCSFVCLLACLLALMPNYENRTHIVFWSVCPSVRVLVNAWYLLEIFWFSFVLHLHFFSCFFLLILTVFLYFRSKRVGVGRGVRCGYLLLIKCSFNMHLFTHFCLG